MGIIRANDVLKGLASEDYLQKSSFDIADIKAAQGTYTLCMIIKKGFLQKALNVLENKGQSIAKHNFFKNKGEHLSPPIYYVVNEKSSIDAYVAHMAKSEQKVAPEDFLFSPSIKNFNVCCESIAAGTIADLDKALLRHGCKSFEKQDFIERKAGSRACLDFAAEYGHLDLLAKMFREKKTPFSKADYFVWSGTKNAFANALASNNILQVIENLKLDKDPLTANDFVEKDGTRKQPLFSQMLASAGAFELATMLEKDGFFISKEEATNSNEKQSFLERAVADSKLELVIEHLIKGGDQLKRTDFIKGNSDNLVSKVAIANQIAILNDYLSKNGEKKLSIRDVSEKEYGIYASGAFEKLLGIKGFSDKPKDIKEFWEKIPLDKRNKEREKAYKNALQKAVSLAISSRRKARSL